MPENFEIAFPWILSLLPLPILVAWLIPPWKEQSTAVYFPTFSRMLSYSGKSAGKAARIKRRVILNRVLLALSWVLMLGALSGPRLLGAPDLKVKTSRSFLILADISNSMDQRDWEAEGDRIRRWEGLKEVMKAFIGQREGDRMGLIFFGSAAYVQAPFTADLDAVETLLDQGDVGMAGESTHLGKAIAKGMELFERDTLDSKVMLLLTDGVDAGDDIQPLDAAKLAAEDSVVVHTLGIGDPGEAGNDLDEETLKAIAETTRGRYFLARDQEQLQEVYRELDKLEPLEYEERSQRPVKELYPYPLAMAMGLLTLSYTISLVTFYLKGRRKKNTPAYDR